MHDHNSGPHAVNVLFTAANLVIALGYLAVPFMVLRYLPLTRLVLAWGIVFFAGCAGTHMGMALLMHHVDSWFWTIEHLVQAVGTWGFIITFTAMLRKASERRLRKPRVGGDVVASPAEDGREK
jgi:hypothetical protein